MITRSALERLERMQSEAGIVSLHLGLRLELGYDREQRLKQFKGAVRRFLRRPAGERWRGAVERERERIESWLADSRPTRGLALFASEPEGIWERFLLDVSVPSIVAADTRPQTAILARVVLDHPRLAVAVVQRDRSRIYLEEQGDAEKRSARDEEVPGQHSTGGWSQARFERHIEFHVDQHLGQVVDELQRMDDRRPFGLLALGGSEDAVNRVRDALPPPLAARVAGSFSVDFKHDTEAHVLDRARTLRRQALQRRDGRLVEEIVDAAESGAPGALGMDPTLDALRRGAVRELALVEGLGGEGVECERCDFFEGQARASCPACDAPLRPAPDLLELVWERASATGAGVRVVQGPARDALAARGGIGALLRY